MYANVGGGGTGTNRSRIFVPHFPKRVSEEETLELKNQNEMNIQQNYNLQQLISNTDKNYAMNNIADQSREDGLYVQEKGRQQYGDGTHGFNPKDANTAIWDQSFMSDQILNQETIIQSEFNESMVIDNGNLKTQDHTMLNITQVSAIGNQPTVVNSAHIMGQTTNHSWL